MLHGSQLSDWPSQPRDQYNFVLWQTSSFIQLQMPLSEKAKGKQRAIALFSNLAGTSSKLAPRADVEQLSRDLVVRFTDSSPDLTVVVEEGSI